MYVRIGMQLIMYAIAARLCPHKQHELFDVHDNPEGNMRSPDTVFPGLLYFLNRHILFFTM